MVEIENIGNQIEFSLFDVFTESFHVTQFQPVEEHTEVIHEANY
jgi:hypothetical protein